MAIVTDKIKSVVDFLVKGFEPRETIFDDMAEDDMEGGYEVQDNLAIDPAYSYQSKPEKNQELKVVTHPNYRGYEVRIMEPRSFDDAAQIVQHLKDRQTIVLQKVGDLVFVFTPSNVTLSVDVNANQNKFNDSLWRAPLQ